MLGMGVHGAGKHLCLYIPTERDIVGCALCMGDPRRILLNDRSFVEIGGHIVSRATDQLNAGSKACLYGFAPLKLGRNE